MTLKLASKMENPDYLLAIDSGNTAIKWGLHDGLGWIENGVVLQSARETLQQNLLRLPTVNRVIISNVMGKAAGDDIKALLDPMPVSHQWWITAQINQCGVHNGYASPDQLGSDRWAALIAAWFHLRRECLVISIGTAMTVDVLSDTGEFRGGIILPGPKLMQQALVDQTAGIEMASSGKFQSLPDNTKDAVYSGMIQALTGAVERMYALISSGTDKPPPMMLVSGGDAAIIREHFRQPCQVMDNLVLEGLVVIAREMLDPA